MNVDFSENYGCKHNAEVQSVNFGAAHQQALCRRRICSYLLRHYIDIKIEGPPAIWQHLEHILKEIGENFPDVTTIHFFSNRPCKQRGNFYLFSTEMFKKGCCKGNLELLGSQPLAGPQ